MKKTALILLASIIVLLSSCKFGPYQFAFTEENVEDRSRTITRLQGPYLPSGTNGLSTYSFLVVTDMHIGAGHYKHDHNGFFIWFQTMMNCPDPTKRPQFIINLGDIADSGRLSEFKDYYIWSEKVRDIARNSIDGIQDFKIYSVVGNHDLYNNGRNYFLNYTYPHIYSYCFDFANNSSTQGFEFYFLDSGNGTLGRYQLEDLQSKMKKSSKPKIILSHYPVYAGGILVVTLQDTLECAKILTIGAENNVKLMLEGHAHRHYTYNYRRMYEEVTPSYASNNAVNLITVDETLGTCVTDIKYF